MLAVWVCPLTVLVPIGSYSGRIYNSSGRFTISRKAAALVRSTAYPQADEFASGNILNPPSKGEMLERFKRVELKQGNRV